MNVQLTPFGKIERRIAGFTLSEILLLFSAIVVLLFALYLRMSGLFRGLGAQGIIYHPDEPKQILALYNYINGKYIQHVGNLFYDGYPYGLNHLDEYILRPILFLFDSENIARPTFYYLGRSLRLLYSVIILLTGYQIVYTLTKDRKMGLLALLLLAIAPLSVTVAHFATGDIGVDLFCAICFISLLLYIGSDYPKFWLFLSGVAIGAAFSAKYNGLLIAVVPAIFLSLEYYRNRRLIETIMKCVVLGSGMVAGLLIFTPHLLMDFKTSVDNILANFTFIKNYHVPAAVREMGFFEKALLGLKKNSFYIIGSLGTVLFLTSVLGILHTGKNYWFNRKTNDHIENSLNIYVFSLALFPLITLIISISGKYVVQPFHFSYLQLPLVVVACYVLSRFFSVPNKLLRSSCVVLLVLIIVELGLVSTRDNFFWRLDDSMYYAENFPESIFKEGFKRKLRVGTFRSITLEPSGNTTVFRNRHRIARGPDSAFWQKIGVAPVPQVPNPFGKDWLFVNGPSFPKNERMIKVNGGRKGAKITRYLVFHGDGKIKGLGFRSGSFATQASISIGNQKFSMNLDAHQQKIIDVSITGETDSMGWLSDSEVKFVPFEISVPHDDLWITFLTTQKEKDVYSLFGGGQDGEEKVPDEVVGSSKNEYLKALSHVQFLNLSGTWVVKQGKRLPIWGIALPAGHYTMTCKVEGVGDNSTLGIEYVDAKSKEHNPTVMEVFQIEKGVQEIEYSFTKPFSPYQMHIILNGVKGKSRVLSLELQPDYQKILEDFHLWRHGGKKPEWISRF